MDPFAVLPPELHRLTVQHLNRKTIVACALVSRSWSRLFVPSVWELVTITTDVQFRAFRASVNNGALSRHGHLIRALKAATYGVVVMLVARGVATCTNLTQLDTAFRGVIRERANEPIVFGPLPLACLLKNNPGLKSVTLHAHRPRMQLSLSQVLSALPANVEYLKLDSNTASTWSDEVEWSIEAYKKDLASAIRETDHRFKGDVPTLKLRRLELLGTIQSDAFVLETLKRSPLLECLAVDPAMDYMYSDKTEGLKSVLRDHCPALTSLYMNPGRLDDEYISHLVDEASTKGWKHLTFKGEGFRRLTEAAILKHANSLESVHLDIEHGFPSSVVQKLFCSAPNLKSFRVGWQPFVRTDVQLNATDMIQSSWVCHSLEKLHLCISGIPRPDLTARTNGRPLKGPLHEGMSMESSYTVQRQVYAQLGKLTKLRELVLSLPFGSTREHYEEGFSGSEYGTAGGHHSPSLSQAEPRYECLSFTLESGLDLLGDLKELRVIDLRHLVVGIDGEAEQRWVKEHWPLVRQI
ncbi:unnamed protein product [Mortierella alpina]